MTLALNSWFSYFSGSTTILRDYFRSLTFFNCKKMFVKKNSIFLIITLCFISESFSYFKNFISVKYVNIHIIEKWLWKSYVYHEVMRNKRKDKEHVNLYQPERFIFLLVKSTHSSWKIFSYWKCFSG